MVCPTGGFGGTFGGPTVAVAGTGIGVGTDGGAVSVVVGTITGVSCAGGVGAGVGNVAWLIVICFLRLLLFQHTQCFFAGLVFRAYLSPRRKVPGVNGASFNLFTFMIEGWLPYWKTLFFCGLRGWRLDFVMTQDRKFRLF